MNYWKIHTCIGTLKKVVGKILKCYEWVNGNNTSCLGGRNVMFYLVTYYQQQRIWDEVVSVRSCLHPKDSCFPCKIMESCTQHMLGLYVDVHRRITGRRSTLSTEKARMKRRRTIVDREL